jgi:lysophospholipase L1-like esterase
MAWTSILERKLDSPLINLGFSGNGRMEEELIDLLAEIDAKMHILDCLPNLTPNKDRTLEDVKDRMLSSVRQLRKRRPLTPILLAQHAGYSDGDINESRRQIYEGLNQVLTESFTMLKAEGVEKIYLIRKADFGLGIEDFVDGTHPTDLGMMHYAEGYEKQIRKILRQPQGTISTTIPVTQMREPGNYIWEDRHNELLRLNQTDPPEICFFGNSITHFWGGEPRAKIVNGGKTWDMNFEKLGVRNFGFGWDRIENVLWRVNHGELDGFEAKQIVMMLGTNNLHLNTDEEINDGLELLLKTIQQRQTSAQITLIGIYPRRAQEERVRNLNLSIAQLAGLLDLRYIDIGKKLLDQDGKIDESYFLDGLHPNEKGYEVLGPLLKDYLTKK